MKKSELRNIIREELLTEDSSFKKGRIIIDNYGDDDVYIQTGPGKEIKISMSDINFICNSLIEIKKRKKKPTYKK